MCVAAEDEPGGDSAAGSDVPEIVVTAPRIGLNMDVAQLIDWGEVAKLGLIGVLGGAYELNPAPMIAGGLAGVAAGIESQPGVDLEDLFEIKNDMIVIPGLPSPYLPMY